MPMIYRRSTEKQDWGLAGAISSVLPSRTGTDGAFLGTPTWSATTSHFTSATASFVSGDVGRLVRLTNTPSKRYNGVYIIDSIVSGTEVVLRKNHNISGHPGSPAQFGETGSSITWRISESCTFTTDAAQLDQSSHPGSYITIYGASPANTGTWRISHFLTTSTCILSKSYIWYVADTQTYSEFVADDNISFSAATGLRWTLGDRECFNGADQVEALIQAAIDAGWVLWQQRGSVNTANQTTNILGDVILRSVGETNVNLPEGKIQYMRFVWTGSGRTAVGVFSGVRVFYGYQMAWDRTTSPGTSPGSGLAALRGQNGTTPPVGTYNMTTITIPNASDIILGSEIGSTGSDLLTPGRGTSTSRYDRYDLFMWGDADEFHAALIANLGVAASTSYRYINWGFIKPIGQNPFQCALAAVTTGGAVASKTFNTGTHDLSANGYQVGDRIYVHGINVSGAEYIEGGTITAFGGTTPNFTVTATSLAATWKNDYGAGTDSQKGYIGSDPFPAQQSQTFSSGFPAVRIHNTANLQNATGRDYDATNLGLAANNDPAVVAWTQLAPNARTANPGVSFCLVRYDTGNEFRGKYKNFELIRGDIVPIGEKLFDPVAGVYWVVVGAASNAGAINLAATSFIAGPFSKVMAGVH